MAIIPPPTPPPAGSIKRLLFSKVFDTIDKRFLYNQKVTIDEYTGLIIDVSDYHPLDVEQLCEDINTYNLRHLTIIPGLIDAHVHLFLHPYSETPWQTQVLDESLVERTVRAVAHARSTVMAGYTTVRDLGTEGAQDADIHLRKALSPPLSLSPAPRIYLSSKAIVSTGSYGPKTQKWDEIGGIEQGDVVGAEVADGVEEIRKVVRRQIGRGADWIKLYADYGTRSNSVSTSTYAASRGYPVFTFEELKTAVDTAANQGVKVAAHATRADVIRDCVKAGISTIEHGYDADEEALEAMRDAGVIWVPTIAAYSEGVVTAQRNLFEQEQSAALSGQSLSNDAHRLAKAEVFAAEDRWARMQRAFKIGVKVGVMIACGGDTGVFAHGRNNLEMERMIGLGVNPLSVLCYSTWNSWHAVRPSTFDNDESYIHQWEEFARQRVMGSDVLPAPGGSHEQPLGAIRRGFAADIVGVKGSLESTPESFIKSLKDVEFVMQAGKVLKGGES